MQSNYYQIAILMPTPMGHEHRKVHVLASNYPEAIKQARLVTWYEFENFKSFVIAYDFLLKECVFTWSEFYSLPRYEHRRCYVEAMLRVHTMGERLDSKTDTCSLLMKITKKLLKEVLKKKR